MKKTILLLLMSLSSLAQYKNLIMEGGGIRGICYVGALKELEKKGILPNIERVGGTSAGAIQACLLALGYSAQEIEQITQEIDYEKFNDGGLFHGSAKRIKRNFGWHKGDVFAETMAVLIAKKTNNPDLTFAELHDLAGKNNFRNLYAIAGNLTLQRTEIFSYETYPNMKIKDAVRASMSIPLYFQAVVLDAEGKPTTIKKNPTANIIVDGGLIANYPITLFDSTKYQNSKEPNQVVFNQETLGLRLEREAQIVHNQQGKQGIAPFEVQDFKTYMMSLYTLVGETVNQHRPEDLKRTISISTLGISPEIKKIPIEIKNKLIESGRMGANRFFEKTSE